MVKGDPSNMTVSLSYCDGSEPWETLARAYESGGDQQRPRPFPVSQSPCGRDTETGGWGGGGGTVQSLVCRPLYCRLVQEQQRLLYQYFSTVCGPVVGTVSKRSEAKASIIGFFSTLKRSEQLQ
jgi:hypothetical protein